MGFYSVMISKENLKVYAFEPILNNYSQLYDNKNLNQFDNMEIFNFALSNIEKDIEMWVPDKEKTGGYSIYDREDEEINKYKIEEINKSKSKSKIGDNIIKIENKKIAIKIDVERHEFKVLEGLSKIFRQNEILLQIELFKERQQKIISYLRDKNFQHINTIEKDYYTSCACQVVLSKHKMLLLNAFYTIESNFKLLTKYFVHRNYRQIVLNIIQA